MIRQANAIDFWRGFALITIFINHIPGIYFERFTYRNLSISDSADLFVFLAGWALFLVANRFDKAAPTYHIFSRLGGRAVNIYAAQILISTLAIAILAGGARLLENPLLLEWHNAAAIFYDPTRTQIGLALLTHQLGYFDILPLYVILMLVAPFIVVVHRVAPALLLPLSFAVYLSALIFQMAPPTWPAEGAWFFNPLAWQFVFVLGFSMARPEGAGAFVRRHIGWFRIAAVPFVVAGALMMLFEWWPDPTTVPDPVYLFIAEKTYATPIRMIQFLSLVALGSMIYPYLLRLTPVAPIVVGFLSKLGRNSLNVFCVGSLLSLVGQILRFYYEGNIIADIAILVFGIALLGLTAWLSECTKLPKRN